MIYMELRKAILEWLLEHKVLCMRVNSCIDHFRAYIYDSDGNYLIRGEEVEEFIRKANDLIYYKT